jgi:hypothetical protein
MAKIELPIQRDFGQLIGDPILFFRQNLKVMGRFFLFFIVPLLLITTVITVFGLKDLFTRSTDILGRHSSKRPNLLLTSVAYIFFIFIYIFQQAFVGVYMVLYHKNKSTTIRDTMAALRNDWKLILLTYLVFIPIGVISFALSFSIILLAAAVGKYLAGLLLLVAYLALIYTTIPLSNLLMVRLRERLGLFAAVAKCFKITLGKWWKTFGGFVMLGGVFYSLMILAFIPFYIVLFIVAFNRVGGAGSLPSSFTPAVTGVFVTAVVFWMVFLSQVFYIYIGINYFTLSEVYDNFELRSEIEQIGAGEQKLTDKQEGEY